MKKILIKLLALIAFLGFSFLTFDLGLTSSYQKSIDKNLKIQNSFEDAGKFVLSFIEKNNKLPTNSDLKNYLHSKSDEFEHSMSINDELTSLPTFIVVNPKDPFLVIW